MQVFTENPTARKTTWQQAQSRHYLRGTKYIYLPVFQMLSFHLSYLATGKIKHFFAQQFKDHHVVLTKAFASPARSHNITYKSWPVLWPFLFQNLKRETPIHQVLMQKQILFDKIQNFMKSNLPEQESYSVSQCTLSLSGEQKREVRLCESFASLLLP